MTHLELENLASEYLEGQLEPARRAMVEAHLAGCAECREVVAGVRRVMELCRSAEDLEPAAWLTSKVLLATVGQRKPRLKERLAEFFRPVRQPRVAYSVAMAVFSFSIIVNAAGINLRNFRLEDLNPRTWIYQANRTGHLLYARAEKFYYDLRFVYEMESRLRRLRAEPKEQENETPKPETTTPPGGSTDSKQPGNPQLASAQGPMTVDRETAGTGRSPNP